MRGLIRTTAFLVPLACGSALTASAQDRPDAGPTIEARVQTFKRTGGVSITAWGNTVSVPGTPDNLNQSLEYAGRVADYLEFAELLALDALERRESAGGHFREESQTPEGEAMRDDEHFSYVAAWEFKGVGVRPELHKEPLEFEEVHPTQRSYK